MNKLLPGRRRPQGPASRVWLLLTGLCVLLLFSPANGEEEEPPTPLAGEAFDTEVMGEPVKVPHVIARTSPPRALSAVSS